MLTSGFQRCCQVEQLFFLHSLRCIDVRYLRLSHSDGAGFIQCHNLYLSGLFQRYCIFK